MAYAFKDSKRKILLITPDQATKEATLEFYNLLLAPTYSCISVNNDNEAVNFLQESQKKPETRIDFLVANIQPDSHAQETLIDRVKSLYSNLPMIIISEESDFEAARSAIKKGALAYIEKHESLEKFLLTELKPLLDRNMGYVSDFDADTKIAKIKTSDFKILFVDLEGRMGSESNAVHSLTGSPGFDVHYSYDEVDALKFLRQSRTDMVLINRPKGSDFRDRLLRTIKNTYLYTQLVHFVSSGRRGHEDMNFLKRYDVNDFLPLNISEDCFLEEILRLQIEQGKRLEDLMATTIRPNGLPGGDPGILLIVGQRGVGKSSGATGATCAFPCLTGIITGVGRSPRPGEIEGIDHYFLNDLYLKENRDNKDLFDFHYVHRDGYSVVIPHGKIQRYFRRGGTLSLVLTSVEAQQKFLEEFDSQTYNIKSLLIMPYNAAEVCKRTKEREDLVPETLRQAAEDYTSFSNNRYLFDDIHVNENYRIGEGGMTEPLVRELRLASLIRKISDMAYHIRYSHLRP